MNLPSYDECLALMDRHSMLDNIRAHSLQVARVARILIDGLYQSQADPVFLPPPQLVICGALLHDIAKTASLVDGTNHALEGAKICDDLGYPEIAEIVEEHVILKSFPVEHYARGRFRAKDLVYYADKRVRHDQIVSLEERLEYILKRYGQNDPTRRAYIRKNFALAQTLETHLFSFLQFQPLELAWKTTPASLPEQKLFT